MAQDPIKTLLDSRKAGEAERLRKIGEDAAAAWWESLSDEQREILIALDYDAIFFLQKKMDEARKRKDGR